MRVQTLRLQYLIHGSEQNVKLDFFYVIGICSMSLVCQKNNDQRISTFFKLQINPFLPGWWKEGDDGEDYNWSVTAVF